MRGYGVFDVFWYFWMLYLYWFLFEDSLDAFVGGMFMILYFGGIWCPAFPRYFKRVSWQLIIFNRFVLWVSLSGPRREDSSWLPPMWHGVMYGHAQEKMQRLLWTLWMFDVSRHLGVSKNRGTPKSSILIGFSIINHPFWGTPIFGNTHFCNFYTDFIDRF